VLQILIGKNSVVVLLLSHFVKSLQMNAKPIAIIIIYNACNHASMANHLYPNFLLMLLVQNPYWIDIFKISFPPKMGSMSFQPFEFGSLKRFRHYMTPLEGFIKKNRQHLVYMPHLTTFGLFIKFWTIHLKISQNNIERSPDVFKITLGDLPMFTWISRCLYKSPNVFYSSLDVLY